MRYRPLLSLGIVLAPAVWALPPILQGAHPPCTIDIPPNNEHVSLTNLKRPSGSDYVTYDSATNDTIYLNVCRSVLKEVWGVDNAETVGVYRERERQQGESLGKWNETLMVQNGAVGMIMTEGSPCAGTTRRMSSFISFQCAHEVYGPGEPYLAGTSDGCAFFFVWRTSYACAKPGRRGFWHSLFAIFWGAVVVLSFYLLLFFSYNRFIKKRGDRPSTTADEAVERARTGLTVGLFWLMDKAGELSKVVMGRDRDGNAGWTPASGRAWWEQNQGYHRQHTSPSRRSGDFRRPVVPSAAGEAAEDAATGAFALGEDDERREDARAARVAKFDKAPPDGNGNGAVQ